MLGGRSIDKFKGRLVAKAFSTIVRLTSLCVLLNLVANLDVNLFQMYVKTAFLNGILKEEIYMDQPICFVSKCQEDKECNLKRFIGGLKQPSRS